MPPKSRNSLDEEIITIRRGLAIYKVKASPYWQARIRDARTGRYITRTTKETSKIKAREAAEELARETLANEKPVERKYTFLYYATRLIAKGERMIANGERNANYVRTIKQFLENPEWGLIKTFSTSDIRELRTRDYQEMMDKLSQSRPDLSSSTRNMLTATFRNVLKVARDDGVIDNIPATPRTRQKDNPRSYFPFYPLVAKEDDVYQRLRLAAKKLGKEQRLVRGVPITDELYDLVIFTIYSFVRPTISELYALKHGEVTVATNPNRLVLTIRKGKTGHRVSITMPAAVSVYKRIVARNPERKPDDYLFLPNYRNRETASKIFGRQFRELMKEAGVVNNLEAGIKYTTYSLRHTALCMRLVHSDGEVNIYTLAKNAGTSVEQIERFYARNLPLSAELAANLQYFGKAVQKPKPKPRSVSKVKPKVSVDI